MIYRARRVGAHLALSSITVALLAIGAHAATFTVTNTDDAGSGSLRDAITQANATVGADRIAFDIAGAGPHVIKPASAWPVLTEAVDIDGTSQDDIVLDGGSRGDNGFMAFVIHADGSTIAGLEIRDFLRGVSIGNRDAGGAVSASGNTVRDNQIHGSHSAAWEIVAAGLGAVASGNTIENNDLHHGFSGGIIQAGDGGTSSGNNIESNQIHDNVVAGMALLVWDRAPNRSSTVTGNVFRGNDIFNNEGAGGLLLGVLASGTLAGNTVEDNHIHDNALHGLWLFAGSSVGESALTTSNRIVDNTIEANAGWGVETRGTPDGLPGGFEDHTVVDNVFQGNTFAGNGLGEINGRINATAVQSATWGIVKSR